MVDRYHDYYMRSQIITTNMYVDVRAITKMMPLNSSIVIYHRIPRDRLTMSCPTLPPQLLFNEVIIFVLLNTAYTIF